MYVNSRTNDFYIGDSRNIPVKLITELNVDDSGSGGGTEGNDSSLDEHPYWPDKASFKLGNTISWARNAWIVSHITSTEVYLTAAGTLGSCTFTNLQEQCDTVEETFRSNEKNCLKTITADETSGKVFVATHDQMTGSFQYFRWYSYRVVSGTSYWTSTEAPFSWDDASGAGYYVNTSGGISSDSWKGNVNMPSRGFRPSICVDLTLY